MPIGSTYVYNPGDLILSTVSSSGDTFKETKLAAATSSLIYFDSNANLNSASLNSITVGTASFAINALTASYISGGGSGSSGSSGSSGTSGSSGSSGTSGSSG